MRTDAPLVALVFAVVVGVVVLAVACGPDATADPGPPFDCRDGLLSDDPLRCYMLEQAVSERRMDIEAIYRSPGGQLQIFLNRTEPLEGDAGLSSYLMEQAYEFLDTPAGHEEYPVRDGCRSYEGNVLKDCRLDFFDFEDGRLRPYFIGPPSAILHVGGSEARRSVPGWASWEQVWPSVAQGVLGSVGLEVSGVDTTSIPEPDCDQFRSTQAAVCKTWKNDPGSRIAGGTADDDGDGYIQVKVPPALPTDPAELEALKRRVAPDLLESEYEDLVLVPVKYDFGDMWRWYVILGRFARSEGNTIGIVGAFVGYNTTAFSDGGDTVFLAGLTDWGGEYAKRRHTMMVSALEVETVVEALPELLPLLGIPVDAVGVVIQHEYRP